MLESVLRVFPASAKWERILITDSELQSSIGSIKKLPLHSSLQLGIFSLSTEVPYKCIICERATQYPGFRLPPITRQHFSHYTSGNDSSPGSTQDAITGLADQVKGAIAEYGKFRASASVERHIPVQ
jgi:hypothetical protein